MNESILIVDDEESIRFTFSEFLREEGYTPATASSYDEAVQKISQTDFALLFVDIIMEGKTGLDLLRTIRNNSPDTQVVIITGAPSIESAAETVRLGALDYIVKPVRQQDLLTATQAALRHKKLKEERNRCRTDLDAIFASVRDGIITVDRKMRIVEINAAAVNLCGLHDNRDPDTFYASPASSCSGACRGVLVQSLRERKWVELHYSECRKKNDARQVVSISASPLFDRQRQFQGCVMVLRDETRLFDLRHDHEENSAFKRLIGISKEMRKVKDLIRALANVQTTVLIMGESGTGKELAVEALHSIGDRSGKPLIKVNCAALADNLLESELFGHVQGAFTGAVNDRKGRFQTAHGGIIFLDEIGDISPKMQVQLLRILESMTFEKVGSSTAQKIDVRIVAATNRNLTQRVKDGLFREDLYYRLKVVQLEMPPLRNRSEDISLLTRYFISHLNRRFGKAIKSVSADVEKLFRHNSWPGNIRELRNTLEYAFILCNQEIISVAHLPAEYQEPMRASLHLNGRESESEVTAIEQALAKAGGNKAKAAKLLSISRRTIYRKMDKYDIPQRTTWYSAAHRQE